MRGARAKKIKKNVLAAIYGTDLLISDKEVKKTRRSIYRDRDFKKIYRAAKKNFTRQHS